MEITTNFNIQPTKTPNFKAIPLARYQTGKNAFVKIYQLEKKDMPFIKKLNNNLEKYFKDNNIQDESKKEIITNVLDTAQKVFLSRGSAFKKSKIFAATYNNKLCGFLAGNIPKTSKTNIFHYSSRKNHSKFETELDWLVTWEGKGAGKSLISEYFTSLRRDRFREVFVRSEVPEETFAQTFYEKLGFVQLPSEREKIAKNSVNKYSIGEYYFGNEEIIPMIAKKSKINKTRKLISTQYNRQSMPKASVDIENIIK